MLVAAARRFLLLLGALGAAAAALGLLVGLLAGRSLDRAVADAFYVVGALLLAVGFVVGNRPPVRMRHDGTEEISLWRSRAIRWATRQELEDALNGSAVFVALGFSLVLIGIAVDGRRSLF